MNNKNFFSKHFVSIIVFLLLGIKIIFMINKNLHDITKPQTPLSPEESSQIEVPELSRTKLSICETPQPKIKTTAAHLEQIKTYLFKETDDSSLLPSDLSTREKEEISKIKNSCQNNLDLLNKYQDKCNDHQAQLADIPPQIEQLKQEFTLLNPKNLIKEQEIKAKKEQFKLASLDDKIRLEAEIKKLQGEKLEIVGQMGDLEVQIGKLESRQRKFQELLSRDEKFKSLLEEEHKFGLTQFKNDIFKSLNSLYDIPSAED